MNPITNTRFRCLFFVLLLLLCFAAKAQPGLSYTQYMDNGTPVNPAYSLTNSYGSVNFTARKQWLGVPGSPAFFMFNTDFPLIINGAKAGIIASDESLGVEHVAHLDGFFAKSIQLNESQNLGVAINAGLRYYSTAYAPLDPRDPAIQNDVTQVRPNIGFGLIFYSDSYYIGFSMPQLTIRNTAAAQLLDNNNFRNQYFLSGGLTSVLDEDFKLKPAALIFYSRGVPLTVDVSTKLAIKDKFELGVNYRNNSEVAALFSIESEYFHLGYSYQFGATTTGVGSFGNSTHELKISFFFGKGNLVSINPGGR